MLKIGALESPLTHDLRARFGGLSRQARETVRRAWGHFAPPKRTRTAIWAEKHRKIHQGGNKGDYRLFTQPAQEGIMDAFDDPSIREVDCQKSSQFGWSEIVLNKIFREIDEDPDAILILFPKEKGFKRFNREKLLPAIKTTPQISRHIDVGRPSPENAQDFKGFGNGAFIQMVGCNAPDNAKSTAFKLIDVEEPDDTIGNVSDQGDPLTIADERLKSHPDGKAFIGGTGTVEGVSKIGARMKSTDKRYFMVTCADCGHLQSLHGWRGWNQVKWLKSAPVAHEVYGKHQPETAKYQCQNLECLSLWSQSQLERAIRVACKRPDKGWVPSAPFTGKAGFYVCDLISLFDGARMAVMARKFLEASHALKHGDDTLMRSFVNNQLGELYELKSDAPEATILEDRGLSYEEWTCPASGLIVTGFVDVQRGGERSGEPRLHVILRAWGVGMESWRVARFVVPGNPLEDATWDALDKMLATPIQNLGGGTMGISALGVDSGDGLTSAAAYKYVRRKQRDSGIVVMATKGLRGLDDKAYSGEADENGHRREIYTPPKAIDSDATGKAAKWGLKVYLIGTTAAKDLISARLKLEGTGQGRMHWPKNGDPDYFQQLLAEVKIPNRKGKKVWTRLAGRANEDLDCEVGCLHAAYRLRLQTLTDSQWAAIEEDLRQTKLPLGAPQQEPDAGSTAQPRPVGPAQAPGRAEGFGSSDWEGGF